MAFKGGTFWGSPQPALARPQTVGNGGGLQIDKDGVVSVSTPSSNYKVYHISLPTNNENFEICIITKHNFIDLSLTGENLFNALFNYIMDVQNTNYDFLNSYFSDADGYKQICNWGATVEDVNYINIYGSSINRQLAYSDLYSIDIREV